MTVTFMLECTWHLFYAKYSKCRLPEKIICINVLMCIWMYIYVWLAKFDFSSACTPSPVDLYVTKKVSQRCSVNSPLFWSSFSEVVYMYVICKIQHINHGHILIYDKYMIELKCVIKYHRFSLLDWSDFMANKIHQSAHHLL